MISDPRIVDWFHGRTITDEVLEKYNIGWDGLRVIIPVHAQDGKFLFNKYRRNPFSDLGAKYTYDKGATVSLFGTQFIDRSKPVILAEGELDALALVSHGFQAVSSTGGCKSFKEEWLSWFEGVKNYICYDSDEPGVSGAMAVYYRLRDSAVISIPEKYKDVTEFFQDNHTAEDFDYLIRGAVKYPRASHRYEEPKPASEKAKSVKEVPITEFVKFDSRNKARCIWHNERTPSMQYYGDNNRVYCFGCGKSGDVIDVVCQLHHKNFNEAVEYLKRFVVIPTR